MGANAPPAPRVSLADTPDFQLGVVRVRPSLCRIFVAEREERLEPRVMQLFVCLASAEGRAVSRDTLIDACWDGRIVTDDAVNRTVAKLRSLARSFEPPPFRVETVAKVGFRLVHEGAGGPVADQADLSVAAPPPEPAPAPVQPTPPAAGARPADVAGSAPPAERTAGRPRAWLALVVAVVALGVVVAWLARSRGLDDNRASGAGRVEVQTLDALQPDPTLQRLATRIADSTVRSLRAVGIETARLAAPHTAEGAAASAEFRITGTIDQDAGRYVVTAQILAAGTGQVLWAGRFNSEADTPAGFPERTANRVADTLHCALGSRGMSRAPMPLQTFALFLGACDVRHAPDERAAAAFIEASRRLVDQAPQLSAAHSMYAVAAALGVHLLDPSSAKALAQLARTEAARALALDADNGEAYYALGIAARGYREREQNLLRAAELSPQLSIVQNFYVLLLRDVGRVREALALNATSFARDPFSQGQARYLAVGYAAAGELDQADRVLEQLELISVASAREARTTITFWWKPPGVALATLREVAGNTVPEADLACFEAYLGRLVQAAGRPLQGLPAGCDAVDPRYRVRMLARQGDVDGAFALLKDSDLGFPSTRWLWYPEMGAVLRDPRFPPLARRAGLAEYWQETGRWPDFCREPGVGYACEKVFSQPR